MYAEMSAAAANARAAELQREGRRTALAALATCCREKTNRFVAWLRKGQLGPGYVECCV